MPNTKELMLSFSFRLTRGRVFVAILFVFMTVFVGRISCDDYRVDTYYPVPYGGYQRIYVQSTLQIGEIGKALFVSWGPYQLGDYSTPPIPYPCTTTPCTYPYYNIFASATLNIRSVNGNIYINPSVTDTTVTGGKAGPIAFSPDVNGTGYSGGYSGYLNNFCVWQSGTCSTGYTAIARAKTSGTIKYSDTMSTQTNYLCCHFVISS